MSFSPPAVAFVAPSGTGKTTLVEKVVASLKRRGYRVGALKHTHHGFEVDRPGKDSFRFFAAGADTTAVVSPDRIALVKRCGFRPAPEELVAAYFADVDIVLAEGFSDSALPKIEVHRGAPRRPLFCRGERRDPNLVAVASDESLSVDVPVLDVEDAEAVADFLETRFLTPRSRGARGS